MSLTASMLLVAAVSQPAEPPDRDEVAAMLVPGTYEADLFVRRPTKRAARLRRTLERSIAARRAEFLAAAGQAPLGQPPVWGPWTGLSAEDYAWLTDPSAPKTELHAAGRRRLVIEADAGKRTLRLLTRPPTEIVIHPVADRVVFGTGLDGLVLDQTEVGVTPANDPPAGMPYRRWRYLKPQPGVNRDDPTALMLAAVEAIAAPQPETFSATLTIGRVPEGDDAGKVAISMERHVVGQGRDRREWQSLRFAVPAAE